MKGNLAKRGCLDNTRCVLWSWFASYNNFNFDCNSIHDLWNMDRMIPLRDPKISEIRKAFP